MKYMMLCFFMIGCSNMNYRYSICDGNGANCTLHAQFKDFRGCLNHKQFYEMWCDDMKADKVKIKVMGDNRDYYEIAPGHSVTCTMPKVESTTATTKCEQALIFSFF